MTLHAPRPQIDSAQPEHVPALMQAMAEVSAHDGADAVSKQADDACNL